MSIKLRKELGLLEAFSIAAGAMIGSGLFILPSLAYNQCGPSVIFAYILAAVMVFPAVLSKAELSTAMPKAGGDYFFIDRSLGACMGTLGGISAWFSLSLKSAFALVGLGMFLNIIVPGISYTTVKIIAVCFLFLFTALNICGTKMSGKAQVWMVTVLLGILLAYIIAGVPEVQSPDFSSMLPDNFKALFATAGFIFVSFGGLTKIASVAEEIKDPGKNIPIAMISSWLVIGILYTVIVFITMNVLDDATMRDTPIAVAEGAKIFMGTPGLILLCLAGILAVVTTANAGILSASRAPMAMSRDSMLPSFFSKINARFGTPHYAIIATGVFMLCVIIFLDLENLVKVASTLKILLFIMVNLSVIVMRESKMGNYRPKFKSPLYPWMQIAGIIGPLFLLFEFGLFPLMTTAVFLAGGMIFYFVYARPRTSRESGLIYIMEKLVSRHLAEGTLKEELKQIILERDEIVEDRFDELVRNCAVLDIEEAITFNQFFDKVSKILAERADMNEKALYDLLWERERESSTVITHSLAVPHIIIPGENKFDLILARCKGGLFPNLDLPPVNTVFVLIGTRDQRHNHLKALAAIAHIAQNKTFEGNWLQAKKEEDLRDVILLAERHRAEKK